MTTLRAALYVYRDTKVWIAPTRPIELFEMDDFYNAKSLTKVSDPTTLELSEGVYGFFYEDKHGLEADPDVGVVSDVQRKRPWPSPPPPPPPDAPPLLPPPPPPP